MLAGAFSCRHLNAHRSDEYIVPEASDGDVTDTACPGRILLVEQQVSSPLFKDRNRHTSDFHVAPRRATARRHTNYLQLNPAGGIQEYFQGRVGEE
jgi:hypothetical protein